MEEYEKLFKEESKSIVKKVKEILFNAEKSGYSPEDIREIFRYTHTLKGMCAAMGKEEMADVFHKLENILADVRDKNMKLPVDVCRYVYDAFEKYLKDEKIDFDEIKKILEGKEKIEKVKSFDIRYEDIRNVKVPVEKLDKFLDAIQNLLVLKDRLWEIYRRYSIAEIEEVNTGIERLVRELYQDVLGLRLVRFSEIVLPFREFVKLEAEKMGKKVNFVIAGEDVEIDRAILEEMREPILHLLRNAVFHGIESPEERVQKGKNEVGTIRLELRKEKEEIFIRVSDDGRGIDLDMVRKRAVEMGIISSDKAGVLGKRELLDILTYPGFTSVGEAVMGGGRGVGLDVVKKLALKYGGNLEIKTQKDKGTTFEIRLPLTLAIMRVLLVEAGNEIFGIPSSYVEEIVKVSDLNIFNLLGFEVVEYKDSICPVGVLSEKIGHGGVGGEYGIILASDEGRVVLKVDDIKGYSEITVSSLPSVLRGKSEIIGVGVRSDGRPVVILDPWYLTKVEGL